MRDAAENTDFSDSELVTLSLAGERDAFGRIVTRYQTLLCSLAYSATGSLSQSEDLAQETFVTAWKQLADLREPEKLRSWLCRISRNLTYDAPTITLQDLFFHHPRRLLLYLAWMNLLWVIPMFARWRVVASGRRRRDSGR